MWAWTGTQQLAASVDDILSSSLQYLNPICRMWHRRRPFVNGAIALDHLLLLKKKRSGKHGNTARISL